MRPWPMAPCVGSGVQPKWSPSGDLLAARDGDSLVIYDANTLEWIRSVSVPLRGRCDWLSETEFGITFWGNVKGTFGKPNIWTVGKLDLSGNYVQILCDTLVESAMRTYSVWCRLANGSTGFWVLDDGRRVEFWNYENGQIVRPAVDTSDFHACDDFWRGLESQHVDVLSTRDCGRAFAIRPDDRMMVVIDTAGKIICELGERVRIVDQNNMRTISGEFTNPTWSSSGRFLGINDTWDEGHVELRENIWVIDVEENRFQMVTGFDTTSYLGTVQWSPTNDKFTFSSYQSNCFFVCRLVRN